MTDMKYMLNDFMRVAQADSGGGKPGAQSSRLPPTAPAYHLCWLREVPCMQLRTDVREGQLHVIWLLTTSSSSISASVILTKLGGTNMKPQEQL